jgi:predicted amidophosphoribosyltransferase
MELHSAAASAIIAFKDRGRTATKVWLARGLAPLLQNYLSQHPNLSLVSMPVRAAAIKRRGFDHARTLALALQAQTGVSVAKGALTFARQASDQRNLGVRGRSANLAFSMVAKPLKRPVVLVDDVVTTGATLLEGRRALLQAGVEVIGFVTIAETLANS